MTARPHPMHQPCRTWKMIKFRTEGKWESGDTGFGDALLDGLQNGHSAEVEGAPLEGR
jgi:hypothetical protein